MAFNWKGLPTWEKGAIVLGGGIAAYMAYRMKKNAAANQAASSSTTSSTATDPVTGLPYSEDNTVDPATGMTYLAEAQQYGSVSAAESQAGSAAYGYGGYGSGGYSGLGYGYPSGYSDYYGYGSAGAPTVYSTNAQWAQAVEAGLTNLGYGATDVGAAVGRYLGDLSLTADQATIIQTAVAEYGPPPVGTFQIIQQSSSPGPTSTGTGTVKVPDCAGQTAGEAHNLIVAAGLVPTDASAGQQDASWKCTGTNPAAGTEVAQGSSVAILAEAPAAQVTVPNVVGGSLGDAHNILAAAGLKLTTVKPDPSYWKVTAQNPAAGHKVSPGSSVSVSIVHSTTRV